MNLTRINTMIIIVLSYFFVVSNGFNLEPRVAVVKVGPKGSYFGYSVAQHITDVGGQHHRYSRVLVGAPRYKNSGGVFQCDLTTLRSDCKLLDIEDPVIEPNENRTDQWLGVSVRSQGVGGKVVACAHRFVETSPSTRWGLGVCYALTSSLDYDYTWRPCKGRSTAKAHEEFGYCQAGTSSAITNDNNILFGAPGTYTWRGTLFGNSVSRSIEDEIQWYLGPLDKNSPVDKYSYLGMSITYGKFIKNTTSYVVGAPRSKEVGEVVFFSKVKANPTFQVQLILTGEGFASCFGYELASADLNGDGRTDLVVGAPFYYEKDRGGAIYVYQSSETPLNKNSKYVKITGEPDSRFGFAITNMKDLNKDGFEDIAVGAPYENQGVVYIYLGSKNGILTKPAQIIRSEELPGIGISTFGYSLSGGMDLDNNDYPDLAIGAYDSDRVITIRSRPIIHILTKVQGSLLNIDPNKDGCRGDYGSKLVCIAFETCFKLEQKRGTRANVAQLKYSLVAETFTGKKFSRVFFQESKDPLQNKIEDVITLNSNAWSEYQCKSERAYLKEGTKDILSPIKFRFTYNLHQSPPSQEREGSSLLDINRYPILDQQKASNDFQATFAKDCGNDDICKSDLETRVLINLRNNELILGKVNEVTMNLSIHNFNESAYEAATYIVHPQSLSFITGRSDRTQYPCTPWNETLVKCDLGNPFKKTREPEKISIRFNPAAVKDHERYLDFAVITNSTSIPLYDRDDEYIAIKIVRKAEYSIYGGVTGPQVLYGGEVKGESAMKTEDDIGSLVEHNYHIVNQGPWKVDTVTVIVSWPYEVENKKKHGKWLLYMIEEPKVIGDGECVMEPGMVNPLGLQRSDERFVTPDTDHEEETTTDEGDGSEVGVEGTGSGGRGAGGREWDGREGAAGGGREGAAGGEREGAAGGGKRAWGAESETESETYEREEKTFSGGSTITKTHHKTSTKITSSTKSEERVISSRTRQKRDVVHEPEEIKTDSGRKRVVMLDCERRTAKCFQFRCYLRNVNTTRPSVIKIRARLWNSTFVEDYPDVDWVSIKSSAELELDPSLGIEQNTDDDRATAETEAYPDIREHAKSQEIPLWIIIVAACAGILLLVLIVLGLWKLGFFKRKKPDAMMKGTLEKKPNDVNNADH